MCFSFYFLSFWDNFSGSDLIDNLQEENSNLGLWPLAINLFFCWKKKSMAAMGMAVTGP
jgi:hypothetical protein